MGGMEADKWRKPNLRKSEAAQRRWKPWADRVLALFLFDLTKNLNSLLFRYGRESHDYHHDY